MNIVHYLVSRGADLKVHVRTPRQAELARLRSPWEEEKRRRVPEAKKRCKQP